MSAAESAAKEINDHLENGGVVMVGTYLKTWQYTKKHAGMFYAGNDGELRVKQGKGSNCLSSGKGERMLVSIKFWKEA